MELVSILIPAYKPRFFKQCLTSALAQTWARTEIVVSDDCPTEAIREICAGYGELVRYVRNPSPGILGHNNIRHLCRIAQGSYLKFLFDDDILHPFCVQYLVEALEREAPQGATMAFSPRPMIDADNHPVGSIRGFARGASPLLQGRDVIRRMATTMANPIGEFTTVLFRRRDIFDADGELQILCVEGVPWRGLSDVALFIHLCAKGPVVMVEDVMSYFRVHDQSNSRPAANPEWFYAVADWKLVLDYAISHRLLSRIEMLRAYRRLIRLLRRWQIEAPTLRDDFAEVLRSIRQDIDAGALPGWGRLALRPLLRV